MMKKLFVALCSILLLAAPVASAMVKAPDFEKGSKKVKDDGYVIVAYADGWDRYSEKMCKELLKSSPVSSALGRAVVIEVGVPQRPSKERSERLQKRLGKLELPPGTHNTSYPAFIFYDKNGRRYSIICGSDMVFPEPKVLAQQIKARIEGLKLQQELLARAEKATGAQRAELLGQASVIPHVARPDKVVDQIKQADSSDQSGYIRRLNFQPWGFVEGLVKNSKAPEAIAKLETMLQDPAYSPEQKQIFYAVMIGFYHRSKSAEDKAKIPDLAEKMRALNPESDLGRAASTVARDWAP